MSVRSSANHGEDEVENSGQADASRIFPRPDSEKRGHATLEFLLLILVFFAVSGDPPPMVNESHYLVKAKHYWDPGWCDSDLLASSAKAHVVFYFTFGWLTQFFSLETTAWIGRFAGWSLLAFGLQRLSWNLFHRHYASLAVALVWIAGIDYGNLAGEWVFGGIEAKVPAYGFVLLGLSQLVQRGWNRVWPLLGIASAFHVLTGGWSVVAAGTAWFLTERPRPDRKPLFTPALLLGGLMALLGIIPSIALTLNADPESSVTAAKIYTYYRISHHLSPASFLPIWYFRHGLLIAATLWCGFYYRDDPRLRRLGAFVLGTIAIAFFGLALGMLPAYDPDLAARLLRFYWFRLSDAMVPLMLGVTMAKMLDHNQFILQRVAMIAIACSTILVTASSYQTARLKIPPSVSNDLLGFDVGASDLQQQQVYRDWLAVCRWARQSTPPNEVFLTPRHQQTFKWYAERGEVVNWKDVPQDAASLREWQRRFQEIFPRRLGQIRVTIQYPKLLEYRKRYGVRWMIVDRRVCGDNLPLVRIYPTNGETNSTFAVYELPRPKPDIP